MTPTDLKLVIDDLVAAEKLSDRIAKGRALHLTICRLLERQQQTQGEAA